MKRVIPESVRLAERAKEMNTLLEVIDLILSYSYRITNFDDCSRISFDAASIICPEGTRYFSLGVLVALWKRQELTVDCPACSGKALIVGAECTNPAGMYNWHGICPECRKLVNGSLRIFEVYGRALKSKLMNKKKYQGELDDVIERLKGADRTHKEDTLFINNLDLILSKSATILDDPRLYCCTMESAYIGGMISGCRKIYLGALLELWKKDALNDRCPDCGGKVLIFGAGGSELSGSHSWHGICSVCRKWETGHKGSFASLYQSVYKHSPKFSIKDAFKLDAVVKALQA
jgi:hypothetical protein